MSIIKSSSNSYSPHFIKDILRFIVFYKLIFLHRSTLRNEKKEMEQLTVLDLSFNYNGVQQIIHPVLLQDDNNLLLVDCGYPGFLPVIEKDAVNKDVDLNRLTGIIITHNDIDHTGGLFEVKDKYSDVIVFASAKETAAISGKEKSARLLQAEAICSLLPEAEKAGALAFQQMLQHIKPIKVDYILNEIDPLPFWSNLIVIPTPGHTPGHISLYMGNSKTLIAGDALVIEDGALNIANPQFCIDLQQAIHSVEKLLQYDIERLVCYHGGVLTENISEQVKDLLRRYS